MKIAIIAVRDEDELHIPSGCLFVAVHQTEPRPTPGHVLEVCQSLGNQCGRYLARATEKRGDETPQFDVSRPIVGVVRVSEPPPVAPAESQVVAEAIDRLCDEAGATPEERKVLRLVFLEKAGETEEPT